MNHKNDYWLNLWFSKNIEEHVIVKNSFSHVFTLFQLKMV